MKMKREYYFFCATFALSAVVCFIACTANRVGTGPYNGSDSAPYTQYNAPGQLDPNVLVSGGKIGSVAMVTDGGIVTFHASVASVVAPLGMDAGVLYIKPGAKNTTLATNDSGVVVFK